MKLRTNAFATVSIAAVLTASLSGCSGSGSGDEQTVDEACAVFLMSTSSLVNDESLTDSELESNPEAGLTTLKNNAADLVKSAEETSNSTITPLAKDMASDFSAFVDEVVKDPEAFLDGSSESLNSLAEQVTTSSAAVNDACGLGTDSETK